MLYPQIISHCIDDDEIRFWSSDVGTGTGLLGTDIRYNNYTMKYGIMVYTGIIPWR
jgi:hypothetical protein